MRTGQQSMIDKWQRWKQAVAAEQSGEEPLAFVLRRTAVDGAEQWCKRCFMSGEVWVTLWTQSPTEARPCGKQTADFLAEYCAGQSERHYLSSKWTAYDVLSA